jgi:hypothetical protein
MPPSSSHDKILLIRSCGKLHVMCKKLCTVQIHTMLSRSIGE